MTTCVNFTGEQPAVAGMVLLYMDSTKEFYGKCKDFPVMVWCRNNITNGVSIQINPPDYLTFADFANSLDHHIPSKYKVVFEFECDKDAVLFKLTWK